MYRLRNNQVNSDKHD